MKSENVTTWMLIKHFFGIHTYGDLQTDYDNWFDRGKDGDIAIWRTCEVCGKEELIQPTY